MSEQTTVILGDEYNEELRAALVKVLQRSAAVILDKSWGVGGSQEIATTEVRIGGDDITIESETYIGLSITGPKSAVERLRDEVLRELAQ